MKTFVYKSEESRLKIERYYRQVLESDLAKGVAQRSIDTAEGKTFVLEKSDQSKPPLILIHGSMSNSAAWLGVIPLFAAHFSVYCLDIPGEPGLSDPWRFSLTSESPFRWMESALDALSLDRASFLGMSLGSWYILNFAATKPERVAAMSLITTGGIAPQRTGFILKAILFGLMGNTGEKMLNRTVYHKVDVPPEILEYQNIVSAGFNPLMEPLPIFTDTQLSRLNMPIQYFGGDRDALLDTKKTASRLNKRPQAEINVLKDTGHVIIDHFNDANAFLMRHA